MNIYRVVADRWGYGTDYAVVVLAENINDAIDHAFRHYIPRTAGPGGPEIGYRARLVGVADPEFVGGMPDDIQDPLWGSKEEGDEILVLVANAGG